MERNAWKSYKEVNRHPNKIRKLGTVESVLHSICCADDISWKEAFRRLIHSSAQQGTMPHDRHSIRGMLSESGFYLQAGSYAERPVIEIIKECNERFHDGEQVIVNLLNSPNHGQYVPIIPVRTNGILHYELQFPSDCQKSWAYEVWIRWKDRQDHSIAPRRKTGRKAQKKEMSARDSEALIAFNENPTDNLVGDCAVRALAGVLEITWEEAALKLAEAGDFVCPHINLSTNIEKCLAKEGFEKHGSIHRNGHILNGKEFCDLIHDMFQAGTRLYGYPGHTHAVAILVFDGDYKIVDTWDSTNKPITGYWAKYPERQQRRKSSEQYEPALPEKFTDLSVGDKVIHKVYGVGEVISIANLIATIRFENDVEKKLAVDWVIGNCKAALLL
ncbi:MAG: hypothetical protein K6C68_05045 [Ruminococcus sp.]|nr:hypothetical protein [Ruminococcus sp.]